jgi:hypothetical protein
MVQPRLALLLLPLQWFLEYDALGERRPHPFLDDLTGERGADLAVQALQWCGLNFPGWEPARGPKPERLVSTRQQTVWLQAS